ncbi:MAG: dihydropteroate synthase [Gammaproteobacteria bacterium]|nr:dihydropteroate synthase [Gammaproteobacteria bacterium]
MSFKNIIMIGDRINPQGFKSVAKMVEEEDIAGLQALAVKQADAGSRYIDVTVGPRAYEDIAFLQKVVVALQDAVDAPLCIDYPVSNIVRECLKVYDPAKSKGRPPLINSFAETRLEMMELFQIMPLQAIVMASEYLDENDRPKGSKTTREVVDVAGRMVERLTTEGGLQREDIFVDVVINSIACDTEGLTKAALEAVAQLGSDPRTRGVHITGGLTNIGNMLPKIEFDGMSLRHCMENAFLTRAVPLGFDTILGTPWNKFAPLPEGHPVLVAFDETIQLTGLNAMRRLRALWAKKP